MSSVPENIPRLTLYNFEEPEYEDCDYVLTSPRSLEACSRLDVKPVDLLHKTLAEFKEELQEYDLQPSTIYFFYNEQENERQRKLRKCWEERSQIIKDDLEEMKNSAFREEIPREDYTKHDFSDVPGLNYKIDDILGYGNIEALAEKQRTRSARSLSNDRVTKDFINESAKELHEESMKLRQELMSRKENKFRRKKNSSIPETPVDIPPSPKATSEPISITREKSPTPTERSDGSKSRGSRRPKLSPKDQKILNLMKAKREAEKEFFHRRERLHLAWDEEQKREEAAKMAMENIRRRRLAAETLFRKHEQENWENEKKRLTDMETMEKELAAECCLEHRAQLVSEYQKRKEKEWVHKKDKEFLKKLQEKNMKALSKEEAEMRKGIKKKQKEDLKSATLRKMRQIRQNTRKLKKMNNERFEKCKLQKESLNTQSREGFENLMASLERQHAQAKSNHEKLMKQREMEHKAKRKELEMRIEQNRKLQKQIEEEMWNRQRSYDEDREKEKKYLLAAAAKFADLRAKKVRDERMSRERCQTANMRKVNLCLELWKRKTEENLQGKFKKCEEMQAAKDYEMNQVRASAIESQKMRDKLRRYYDRNNFDKKLLEAELYTKMGNGVQTASKNLSSLSLS